MFLKRNIVFVAVILSFCLIFILGGCSKESTTTTEPVAEGLYLPDEVMYTGEDASDFINEYTLTDKEKISKIWATFGFENWETVDNWQTQANSIIEFYFTEEEDVCLTLTADDWASYIYLHQPGEKEGEAKKDDYKLPAGTYQRVAAVLQGFSDEEDAKIAVGDFDGFLQTLLYDPGVTASYTSYYAPYYGDETIAAQFRAAIGDTSTWEEISEYQIPAKISTYCDFYSQGTTTEMIISEENGVTYILISIRGKQFHYRTEENIVGPISQMIMENDLSRP